MDFHRLFIAIDLPEAERERLINYQKERLSSPVFRLVKPEDLHLTLVFLGETLNDQLPPIFKIVETAAQYFKFFSLRFEEIKYGPFEDNPRLVWIEGPSSLSLENLRKFLINKLREQNIHFHQENRQFRPHITLARLNERSSSLFPKKEEIYQKLSLEFKVDALKIMESDLKAKGNKYIVLTSYPLAS